MTEYPSFLLVFIAGLLSFFSPCVLPLIPSFLGFLGGMQKVPLLPETQQEIAVENAPPPKKRKRSDLIVATVFFILGFSSVFIALSIIVSTTFLLMGGISKYIEMIAGTIVIILGINVFIDFIPFLNYEKKLHIKTKDSKGGFFYWLLRSFIMGAAFGAGWSPCIGPILTSVLFLAGQSGKAGIAAVYLAIYSIGLGIPFLFAAAFFDRFLVSSKWFRKNMKLIKIISGCLLILIGLMIFTGQFTVLNKLLQKITLH